VTARGDQRGGRIQQQQHRGQQKVDVTNAGNERTGDETSCLVSASSPGYSSLVTCVSGDMAFASNDGATVGTKHVTPSVDGEDPLVKFDHLQRAVVDSLYISNTETFLDFFKDSARTFLRRVPTCAFFDTSIDTIPYPSDDDNDPS
jgi:hypothetical protein